MAIPNGVRIKKTISLVNALAKHHNFCVDQNDQNTPDSNVDQALFEDLVNVEGYNSFVPLVHNAEVRDVLDVDIDTLEALVG
jgi:hypothetical protein